MARGNAMVTAIRQALDEAALRADQIDVICGTSWGSAESADKEIGAVREIFAGAQVPLVNYNAHFGFVESAAALLNLSMLLEAMKSGEIAPIPYTREFCADDIAFVREPIRREVRHAMLIGTSDGGNNYAAVLRKGTLDG